MMSSGPTGPPKLFRFLFNREKKIPMWPHPPPHQPSDWAQEGALREDAEPERGWLTVPGALGSAS